LEYTLTELVATRTRLLSSKSIYLPNEGVNARLPRLMPPNLRKSRREMDAIEENCNRKHPILKPSHPGPTFGDGFKWNSPPANGGLLITDSIVGLGLNRFRDHPLQQDLESHGVSTALMGQEKFAITVKSTVVKADVMLVIITMEGQFKFVETKAGAIFCVPFCLLKLAD
jgi:hypothetical protein